MSSTYARRRIHSPHIDVSLVAIVVLSAALIGLGAWVLFDRYAGGSSATQDATTLIDDWAAAWSSGDTAAVASLYTKDAILTHSSGGNTQGSQAIAALAPEQLAVHLQGARVAAVTVSGDFASTFVRSSRGGGRAKWAVVFQLRDGKIAHEWHLAVA